MKKFLWFLVAVLAVLLFCRTCCKTQVYDLENPQVKAFWDQVNYPDDDYTYSLVENYNLKSTYRLDQPWPVQVSWETDEPVDLLKVTVKELKPGKKTVIDRTIDGHTSSYLIWNLVPGRTYAYSVKDGGKVLAKGKFRTEGRRRMICAPSVHNFRDIGGMKTTSGKTVSYGKIYRGGELIHTVGEKRDRAEVQVKDDDIRVMHDDLGIRGEVDFRYNSELGYDDGIDGNEIKYTPLGNDVTYYNLQVHSAGGFEAEKLHGEVFQAVLDHLRKGEAVYLHCAAGADRTGLLCLLLEGVLGVPENDLLKDYELTTFSIYGTRRRDGGDMTHGIPLLKEYPGATIQEKIENFFLEDGITKEEIEEYKSLMLE
ncbi:MAG: tyrosine-protein phosphatase [Bacteroidales bacterium]|nr:tyrosine-protein phosphatase [Bacteroidales bacterium]